MCSFVFGLRPPSGCGVSSAVGALGSDVGGQMVSVVSPAGAQVGGPRADIPMVEAGGIGEGSRKVRVDLRV